MDHLPLQETPVERLSYFSKKWGINLFIKRDDLFGSAGGGNKARMLKYILYKVKQYGFNVLITAGTPHSNFSRAAALMAAQMNLKFVLVLYSNTRELNEKSLNLYLAKLSGADIRECDINNVPQTIETTIKEFLNKGDNPYYIWGGGKSLEGSYSYYDAIFILKRQIDFKINHIICACGTGTTLSGIYVGMKEFLPDACLSGISVARKIERGMPELQFLINELEIYLKRKVTSFLDINLIDKYILGEYACTNSELLGLIKIVAENEGILLDPVYSGKAFYGLSELNKDGYFKKGSNVLFWHTGSVFNLLSSGRIV